MSSTHIPTLTLNKISKVRPRKQNKILKKMLKEDETILNQNKILKKMLQDDGTILIFEREVLERLRTEFGNLYR